MAMIIQDDFWEAAQALPKKQRAPFLYAVAAYGFDGSLPEGNPPWLPVFIVIRKRIDMSNEASEKARKRARRRWDKKPRDAAHGDGSDAPADARHGGRSDAQAGAAHDAQADAQHMQSTCQAHAAASETFDAESESESKYYPLTPSAKIVCRLNERAGTSFSETSKQAERLVADRLSEGFTEEDLAAVVDVKCAQWRGDPKMAGFLRPKTLFGPNFESYLQEARAQRKQRGAPRPAYVDTSLPVEEQLRLARENYRERMGGSDVR